MTTAIEATMTKQCQYQPAVFVTLTSKALTEPIADATPGAADGKLEAVPPSLVWVAAIVSAVAGVMGDHGPPGEGPGGQGEDGDEVGAQTHGQ